MTLFNPRPTPPPTHPGSVLVQLRIRGKSGATFLLTPYKAWDLLVEAFKDHPTVELEKAEIRPEEEEKTSI